MKLRAETMTLLRCPRCQAAVTVSGSTVRCNSCQAEYPIADGIPILIDEEESVFSIADILESEQFFSRGGALVEFFKRLLPGLSRDFKGKRNYVILRDLLLARTRTPRVLVIGGSILGSGMEALIGTSVELVETDVSIGPRTQLVIDGHSIPFADGTFDAVIVQAVLEHVVDPFRVVEEIHRVLAPEGIVYAETPFMQQVHGGAYDFLRFTHLGHRRLFRRFTELDSGPVAGPGTVMAWSWEYFLASFVTNLRFRPLVRAFARITAAPLKYFDFLMIDNPGALDAASGLYFLGRRSETAITDRELVRSYRGCNPVSRKRERSA